MQRTTKQADVIQTSDIKHLHACICLRALEGKGMRDDVTSWHSVLSHRISWCAIAVQHKKEKGILNLILRQSCQTFSAFFFHQI